MKAQKTELCLRYLGRVPQTGIEPVQAFRLTGF
jgi:hypothetical protein